MWVHAAISLDISNKILAFNGSGTSVFENN